jgi:hypothetical protein
MPTKRPGQSLPWWHRIPGNAKINEVLAFRIKRPALPAGFSKLLEVFENIWKVFGKLFINFG